MVAKQSIVMVAKNKMYVKTLYKWLVNSNINKIQKLKQIVAYTTGLNVKV